MPVRSAKSAGFVAELKRRARDGKVDIADMLQVVKTARRGGLTAAKRRTLDREIAKVKDRFDDNPTGSHRAQLTEGAERIYERVRTSPLKSGSAFSQKLPSRPGLDDGNRLGKVYVRDPATGMVRFKANISVAIDRANLDRNPDVVDGFGEKRGEVTSSKLMVNYGQKKFINGKWHVYAFGGLMRKPDGQSTAFAGWVPQSALKSRQVQQMGNVEAPRAADMPGGRMVFKTLDEAAKVTRRWPEHGFSVIPTAYSMKNGGPADYLLRSEGMVNLCYALPGEGGVATDTFKLRPGGDPRGPISFVRSKVPARRIPVYELVKRDGKVVPVRLPATKDLRFVYGRVIGPDNRSRFGWIAEDLLKRAA